ncbi:cell division protein ZapE [Pseudoalteromonas fenneropenaei]|uniref:Cell division protein ZapE n=1 Tax=Pseudoalteromonas fenneropenaei TaxID=1737459 RepID=A0ABV7CC36_9GAMM
MLEQFQTLIESQQLTEDPAQLQALTVLHQLAVKLCANPNLTAQGVYLYGPVGRGKTMLMDMFYQQLTGKVAVQRMHFHHFMAQVQRDLNRIQGTVNPMQHLAAEWAQRCKVLCFDEFFVTDIGDAMIMATLFGSLFEQGVILVTTSNSHPETLYANGLQRARFLPTIALLQQHCQVVNVAGETDHRFAHGVHYTHFFHANKLGFLQHFSTAAAQHEPHQIILCQRQVATLGSNEFGLMFDFMALCSAPRATADYMALADNYSAVYIADVPQMGALATSQFVTQGVEDGYQRAHDATENRSLDDEARRFIALVDEFYDRGRLVILHSAYPLAELYVGERLAFAFERTKSRLVEMQTWRLPAKAAN